MGDPMAKVPTEFHGHLVATSRDVVTLSVRHAQDIEANDLEGDWATATIHLRSLVQEKPTERRVLSDTIIATTREILSVGDADGMVVVPAPGARTRLIVSSDEASPAGLETVWVDLIPAEE